MSANSDQKQSHIITKQIEASKACPITLQVSRDLTTNKTSRLFRPISSKAKTKNGAKYAEKPSWTLRILDLKPSIIPVATANLNLSQACLTIFRSHLLTLSGLTAHH